MAGRLRDPGSGRRRTLSYPGSGRRGQRNLHQTVIYQVLTSAPSATRTHDRQIRRLLLYPAELWGQSD